MTGGGQIIAEKGPAFVSWTITAASSLIFRKKISKKVEKYADDSREYYRLAQSADPDEQQQATRIFGHLGKLQNFVTKKVGKFYNKIEENRKNVDSKMYDGMSREKAEKKAAKNSKRFEKKK